MVEISVDCIDDTGRVPKGQVILWKLEATDREISRDARQRKLIRNIVAMLRKEYPSLLKKKWKGKLTL